MLWQGLRTSDRRAVDQKVFTNITNDMFTIHLCLWIDCFVFEVNFVPILQSIFLSCIYFVVLQEPAGGHTSCSQKGKSLSRSFVVSCYETRRV